MPISSARTTLNTSQPSSHLAAAARLVLLQHLHTQVMRCTSQQAHTVLAILAVTTGVHSGHSMSFLSTKCTCCPHYPLRVTQIPPGRHRRCCCCCSPVSLIWPYALLLVLCCPWSPLRRSTPDLDPHCQPRLIDEAAHKHHGGVGVHLAPQLLP